jgi:hypothetical protein
MLKMIEALLEGFRHDPPDSDYQRGYFAALIELRKSITEVPEAVTSEKTVH